MGELDGPATGSPAGNASKAAWRTWARSLPLVDPLEAGALISAGIEEWSGYHAASHVLIFMAFGHEPDLTALTTSALKTFYTTRTTEQGSTLSIHELDSGSLERHRYGFLQPAPGAVEVDPEVIDLALVPGLAFDLTGSRLGFGQGYYDRLLPTLRAEVPRVGVSTASRVVPRLPADRHDIRMTHLAIETGVAPVDPDAN